MSIQSSAPLCRVGPAGWGSGLAPLRLPTLHALQRIMEDQRAFRRAQLSQLSGEGAVEPARQAVNDIIAAGARRVLEEIECALRKLGTGEYGSCCGCGVAIPSTVLSAVPWAPLCPECHLAGDHSERIRTAN